MTDITQYSPQSGRYIDEDGNVRNFVDELLAAGSAAQPVDAARMNITQFSPRSGRFVAEDGSVYNLKDLLDGIGGGGGGTANYDALTNKPRIEGVTLTGDKSLKELGAASVADVEQLSDTQIAQGADIAANSALLVNNAGKNLLSIKTEQKTDNNVTFTTDHDSGTVHVTGNDEGVYALFYLDSDLVLQAGTYTLSCDGLPNLKQKLYIFDTFGTANENILASADNSPAPQTFTLTEETHVRVRLDSVRSNTDLNYICYPMIRRAEITNDTFEPYYRTQKQLNTDLSTAETEIEEIKSAINVVYGEQADIKAYIGYTENDIYGVEVDVENRIFTRLAGAVDKNGGADFDGVNAFGGRRRCNLADDGTVNAYYGDDDFASDGSNGQVMVEQPKFYYKVVPLKVEPYTTQDGKTGYHNRKARYYISDTPKSGFKVHPAFIRDGKEADYIYLSAFEASLYDTSASTYITDDAQVADFIADKLSSIANVKPMSGLTQNLTRANTRKLAQNRGAGWEQAYAATIAASQLLMLIEYAAFNMQSAIGNGVVNKASSTENTGDNTGATLSLGTASGNTGTYGSVSYRGEENFWGNIWGWIDGLNVKNPNPFDDGEYGNVYVADHSFADNTDAAPYEDTNIYPCKTTGSYINAFGYSEKFDWLFIPTEIGGNSALPVGDYFWNRNANWRVAYSSGGSYHSYQAGAYILFLNSGYTDRAVAVGGRLVYVPIREVAEQ